MRDEVDGKTRAQAESTAFGKFERAKAAIARSAASGVNPRALLFSVWFLSSRKKKGSAPGVPPSRDGPGRARDRTAPCDLSSGLYGVVSAASSCRSGGRSSGNGLRTKQERRGSFCESFW